MPKQKRGKSKQDYETPDEFIEALEARWGRLDIDLAARADNAKAVDFISPEEDTLAVPWLPRLVHLNSWLNPEFGNIAPYAAKCSETGPFIKKGKIFLLTPASIGSEWFAEHVYGKALVLGLRPRLAFKGTPINPKTGKPDGYPKDLALSIFGPGLVGFGTWRWKE